MPALSAGLEPSPNARQVWPSSPKMGCASRRRSAFWRSRLWPRPCSPRCATRSAATIWQPRLLLYDHAGQAEIDYPQRQSGTLKRTRCSVNGAAGLAGPALKAAGHGLAPADQQLTAATAIDARRPAARRHESALKRSSRPKTLQQTNRRAQVLKPCGSVPTDHCRRSATPNKRLFALAAADVRLRIRVNLAPSYHSGWRINRSIAPSPSALILLSARHRGRSSRWRASAVISVTARRLVLFCRYLVVVVNGQRVVIDLRPSPSTASACLVFRSPEDRRRGPATPPLSTPCQRQPVNSFLFSEFRRVLHDSECWAIPATGVLGCSVCHLIAQSDLARSVLLGAVAVVIGLMIGWSGDPRLLPAAMLFPRCGRWRPRAWRLHLSRPATFSPHRAVCRRVPAVSMAPASRRASRAWIAVRGALRPASCLAVDRTAGQRTLAPRYAIIAFAGAPAGIVGWAHPITAAGILFPGWAGWSRCGGSRPRRRRDDEISADRYPRLLGVSGYGPRRTGWRHAAAEDEGRR